MINLGSASDRFLFNSVCNDTFIHPFPYQMLFLFQNNKTQYFDFCSFGCFRKHFNNKIEFFFIFHCGISMYFKMIPAGMICIHIRCVTTLWTSYTHTCVRMYECTNVWEEWMWHIVEHSGLGFNMIVHSIFDCMFFFHLIFVTFCPLKIN